MYRSVCASALALFRQGGVPRFYKGLQFTLIRAAPVSGVLLPCYDLSLNFLEGKFPHLV